MWSRQFKPLLAALPGIALVCSEFANANSLLATNMGNAGTTALIPYTEYQWAFTFNNPQVRVTGMELAFDENLTQAPQARFRDDNNNHAGLLTGSFVRTEGSFKIYLFEFGSTFLGFQSLKYAAFDFSSGGGPISLASYTSVTSIAYDSSAISNISYDYWQPSGGFGDGSRPLFSILAVPEPSTASLMAAGFGVIFWRNRRRS